jgi:uncharacterized protein (DUF2141 family)
MLKSKILPLALVLVILGLSGCAAITALGGSTESSNKVTGTITLPATPSLVGKKYAIYLDTDLGSTDSYIVKTSGTVSGTVVNYAFSAVPTGRYFLYAIFGSDSASPAVGDWVAAYGATSMNNAPASANLEVPTTGTVNANMAAFQYVLVGQDGTGATDVTGTLSLPQDLTGKTFYVAVTGSVDGNMTPIATDVGVVSGTSATYTIRKVPAGTYYVFAIVYDGTPGSSDPSAGDYIGFYGGLPPPATPNLTVPASGTKSGIDITLSPYSSGTGTLTLDTPASTTVAGSLMVSGTYSGTTPSSIVVYLGSTPFPATLGTGTWTATVDTTTVANGTSTLAAVSFFGLNPIAQTAPVVVTVANTPSTTSSTLTYSVANKADTSQDIAFPVLMDIYAVSPDGSKALSRTLKLTSRASVDSAILPAGTYVTLEYSDRNGDGEIDQGDWVGHAGLMKLTAGTPESVETFLYPSNIGAQTTLESASDLNNLVTFSYTWTNTEPADSTHLTAVVTRNPADVTDWASWVLYPNGGSYSSASGMVGCPAGTYGLFLFEDANGNGQLDPGETYYWPSSTPFPSLSVDQTGETEDVTMYLSNPEAMPSQTITYGAADAHVYAAATGNGTIGTVTIN